MPEVWLIMMTILSGLIMMTIWMTIQMTIILTRHKNSHYLCVTKLLGSGSMDYGSNDYGSNTWTSSGSGSSCFDAYTQVWFGSMIFFECDYLNDTRIFRSATLPRSIATLVWTQRAVGTATTASTRCHHQFALLFSLLRNQIVSFLIMWRTKLIRLVQ